ncbi:TagK domain-containing protein [Burkholderia sp. lig30]|uniref:TagK domain-containing protein n=1 Tax=Burkholderia sp. lig30 TaxID=1192124 RepID=UPI000A469578|nr:TagK domain-containing protein [Burkholderia sp. lig30]
MQVEAAGHGETIVDLIGGHSRWKQNIRSQAMAASTANRPDPDGDLFETLHAQYWRALTDPHTALSGSWEEQQDAPATPAAPVTHDSHDVLPTPENAAGAGSIEVLLSGERCLEDAFGRLERHPVPDPEIESVPEVLRLFAPPEFHAAEAGRTSALPPPLTRREHHALSVDSPLAAPAAMKNDA